QKQWAGWSLLDRINTIKMFREKVIKKTETLSETLTKEMGKPITQSLNELKGLTSRLDFFIENAPKVLKEETVFDDKSQNILEKIEHEPLGVIANISAWNYPYFVGSNVFIPALITGNAVLYKPSEFATLTGIAIANLLHESGVPEEIFSLVLGTG